ncbi:hypothetical protein C7S18_20285 [Ahniella affigens]|uniref:Bacterial type II secretion system protein E domain-containing protein n=1 Tax=Ahniella affigens TaxID=2021234 RepID=A0A2P1PWZ8_9GAMM|nr:ATPase, T2SS/T4P/T4SS family [Ahniella affigens]AVP99366.1 hypothetical protein C7S18_20285 [Ahniella affigens]
MSTLIRFIPSQALDIPASIRDLHLKHDANGELVLGDCSVGIGQRAQATSSDHEMLLRRLGSEVQMLTNPGSSRLDLGSGACFRVERYPCRDGIMTAMRRLPAAVPALEQLNLPHLWRELFELEDLCRGGLVLVVAPTGSGKSVTLASIGATRLQRYSGYMTTIEDPIEMPLHGWHGQGKCVQTEVDTTLDPAEAYIRALRTALRAYPTAPQGGTMLLFGEVRDQASAAEVLRAANQGHLVLTTLHGSSIESALRRLIAMATRDLGQHQAQDLTASALRLIITQTLHLDPTQTGWAQGRIEGQLLYSSGEKSPVAGNIRDNDLGGLAEPLDQQTSFLNRAEKPSLQEFLKRFRR